MPETDAGQPGSPGRLARERTPQREAGTPEPGRVRKHEERGAG